MINKAIIFVCIVTFAISCSTDTKSGGNNTESRNANSEVETPVTSSSVTTPAAKTNTASTSINNTPEKPTRRTAQEAGVFDSDVPDACTLITEAEVAAIIGLAEADVNLKDGSNKLTATTRSCFFRWADSSSPSAGILIQVQKNPIPEEYADWPILFIDSKIKNGEQTFDGTDVSYKFKKWDVVGDAGCYSYDAGKYHWRLGNQYVFMVAFNTSVNEKTQMKQATALAKKVMSSFENR